MQVCVPRSGRTVFYVRHVTSPNSLTEYSSIKSNNPLGRHWITRQRLSRHLSCSHRGAQALSTRHSRIYHRNRIHLGVSGGSSAIAHAAPGSLCVR